MAWKIKWDDIDQVSLDKLIRSEEAKAMSTFNQTAN